MDRPIWNSLGLCSGVGLLDLAVSIGAEQLGIDCRPAVLCEWDAYAASVLLARMEDATLEPCPIWCGDLRDFDSRPFRGVVDVLAAGLPCQPYSVAGKQLGNSDKRSHGEDGSGPIPQFLRIVAECRPALVFLENVSPWVRDGWFRPVGEELSRMGYKVEDPLFITAESVGASHKRERVFVLAHDTRSRNWWIPKSSQRDNAVNTYRNGRTALADSEVRELRGQIQGMERHGQPVPVMPTRKHANDLADAERARRKTTRSRRQVNAGRESESGCGDDVGDAVGPRTQPLAARSRPRDSVGESSLFAPGPNADWRDIPAHLWPAIEPGVRCVVDGCPLVVDASRADQLRCSGNAVVPLQAALAFVELVRRVIASN